ncbi:MAG: hypothetical protein LBL30_02185 [Holosporales bacterium]|nr:hypothetical protein [Holosporales bacterium]
MSKKLLINAAAIAFSCFSDSTVDAMFRRPEGRVATKAADDPRTQDQSDGETEAEALPQVRIDADPKDTRVVIRINGFFNSEIKRLASDPNRLHQVQQRQAEWQQSKQSVLQPFPIFPSFELIDYLSKNCPFFGDNPSDTIILIQ